MRISEILTGRIATNEHSYYGSNDNEEWAGFGDPLPPYDMGGEQPNHPHLPTMHVDWSRDQNTRDTVQRWPNAMFATDDERDNANSASYPEMLISPEEHMPDPRFRAGGVANDNARLGRRRGR